MNSLKKAVQVIFTFIFLTTLSTALFSAEVDPDDTGPATAAPRTGAGQNQSPGGNQPAGDPDDVADSSGTAQAGGTGDAGTNVDIPKKIVKFKGEFLTGAAMQLHSPNNFTREFARLRLAAEARFLSVQFYAQFQANYDRLRDNIELSGQRINGAERYLSLREGYIEWETNTDSRRWITGFSVRVGRLIHSWGKGDEFRPTDILNPQDYSNLGFTELNDRKLAVWSTKFNLQLQENWRLEFIFIPVHRGDETAAYGHYFYNPIMNSYYNQGYTNTTVAEHQNNLGNSNYAAKTYFKVFDVDFSIGYYSGYSTSPVTDSAVAPTLYMSYKKTQMAAFDFEFPLFNLVWRGEAGYFFRGKYFSQNKGGMPLEKDYLGLVFGFDKSDFFTRGTYINLQFIYKRIFDHTNTLIAKKHEYGFSLSLYYDAFNYKWRFEIGGMYTINYKEVLFKPKITWKPQSDFEVEFGAILIFGKGMEPEYQGAGLGIYNNKDYFFINIKYSF
jgi:hypothetical protein